LLIFLFIFSIFATSFITETISADSNSYYVSTTGDDSDDGSFVNPFKTIQKAVNVSTNGDTIYVMAGTYLPPSGQIEIDGKDDSNEWLTISNYNDDDVLINGTNCPNLHSSAIDAVFEITDSKYIRITGLNINRSKSCGITARYSSSTYPSFIKVDNCSITNCSFSAFKIADTGGNNITFEWNYLYDNFCNWTSNTYYSSQETVSIAKVTTFSINNNTLINNRAENIDLKGGCNRGTVCYNEINNSAGFLDKWYSDTHHYYSGGPAIMLDSRGYSHNISIYNNLVYGNHSGISLNTETTGHYEYIYIYNNIINLNEDNGYRGNAPNSLYLMNTGNSAEIFKHIYIYSNTIHQASNCDRFLFALWSNLDSSNLEDVYLMNNILSTSCSSPAYGHIYTSSISPDDGVITYNNNSYSQDSGSIFTKWETTTRTNQTDWNFGVYATFIDPEFVDKQDIGGDFHLNSTSPCIDVANDTLVPSFDFDGVNRPNGAGYDRGAYEFLSSYDTNPPLISDISIATSIPLDTNVNIGWENISCIVTDNIAVDTVYVIIVNPNDTETNIEMTKIAGSDCYYYNLSLSDYGNYSYLIWSNDTSNNQETSSSYILSMPPNWDINNDGISNILDLILISNHYNEIGYNGFLREDVDNNGVINILDMNLFSNHYGENWYV